jgi:signal transduction histidine kinase
MVLTVSDDGDGLDEPMLTRAFEPFVTTKANESRTLGGDGLGLTLARSMAESFRGRVHLRSTVGQGTDASIHCPVADGDGEQA